MHSKRTGREKFEEWRTDTKLSFVLHFTCKGEQSCNKITLGKYDINNINNCKIGKYKSATEAIVAFETDNRII